MSELRARPKRPERATRSSSTSETRELRARPAIRSSSMSELSTRPARPERAIPSSSTSVVLFVFVVWISKFSPNIMLVSYIYLMLHSSWFLVDLEIVTSVIEFARSVLSLARADSTEFDEHTPNPVVVFMPEGSRTHMGSTVRQILSTALFKRN
ncbi:hypothetical protein L3X38_024373 [Prunus dulcis]|uniref:Uncharacterized protein n=1 Tax=Prunus dulcis TaxID=3755 RepID=A0AAD4Z635_PRUDU|nr:hypothetical protein L3X38_024373 [Prunus dulcis]